MCKITVPAIYCCKTNFLKINDIKKVILLSQICGAGIQMVK